MNGSLRRLVLANVVTLVVASGCATQVARWRPLGEAEVPDVRPQRKARADKAVREFDERRNVALLTAANTALRQGDHQTCRDSIDKILERDPNHRDALRISAELALETDRPEEAVLVLRRALSVRPADVETAYLLGAALAADDKTSEALPYLRQAATAEPQNREYAATLAAVERDLAEVDAVADAPSEIETPRKAVAEDEPAAEHDAEFAPILAAWEAGRDADCARALAKFLQQRPTHVEANILQAEIDLAAGRRETALRRMDRLVVHYPHDMQVRQACGLVNEAAGEAVKAATFFAEAEALAERNPNSREPSIRNSHSREPHEPTTIVAAAFETEDEGASPNVAPRLLASDVRFATDVTNVPTRAEDAELSAEQLVDRGEAELRAGRIEAGRRHLQEAVERDVTDEKIATAAALAALKQNQTSLSFDLATKAFAALPRSAGLARICGMSAYRQGRYAEAERYLRQSSSLDNSHALTYFLLGSALQRLGQPEAAERHFREAARLDARYATRK